MTVNLQEQKPQTFGQFQRIKSSGEFDLVFKARCRNFDSILTVFCASNGLSYSRLGLSVSKKVGNSPERNRWKRLIREAFRRNTDTIPAGFDFVVIPQKQIHSPDQSAVTKSFVPLTVRTVRKWHKKRTENQ